MKQKTDKELENFREQTAAELKEKFGVKPIILDDNALSIMKYAEEFPENWKKICEALEEKNDDIYI